MALPFFDSGPTKRPDEVLAVDLGTRVTKAVHLRRKGTAFELCGFTLQDAPIFDKTVSQELLSEHLKTVSQAFNIRNKLITLAVGVGDSLVRHVEMPRLPPEDMRLVLRHNSRNYLQQDLTNYVFDCQVVYEAVPTKNPDTPKGSTFGQKQRVLVAGAKQQLVNDYVLGARGAGLTADRVIPGLVGPVNAFEVAMPEAFAGEIVALVDIGFRSSSICILQQGELTLSRVVNIGGDKLTNALTEALNVSYAEAEGIKVGMPNEVRPNLEAVLVPLGRELRASIDFFEHQQDRPVGQVYLSGGSSRSEFVVQSLQNELMTECKTWNPAALLQMSLPPQQTAEIEQAAPQLTVAIGAAVASF